MCGWENFNQVKVLVGLYVSPATRSDESQMISEIYKHQQVHILLFLQYFQHEDMVDELISYQYWCINTILILCHETRYYVYIVLKADLQSRDLCF